MATVKELGAAIASHPNKVAAVFLGFDLWFDVLATGKVGSKMFKKGGIPADPDEPDSVVKIPLPVVGRDIVVCVDITLPPDGFRIAP
jgi:hypothetical protein